MPDAVAYTDPMKTHEDLMKQRRRWINSSLFAFLYVWKNYFHKEVRFHSNQSVRKSVPLDLRWFESSCFGSYKFLLD